MENKTPVRGIFRTTTNVLGWILCGLVFVIPREGVFALLWGITACLLAALLLVMRNTKFTLEDEIKYPTMCATIYNVGSFVWGGLGLFWLYNANIGAV